MSVVLPSAFKQFPKAKLLFDTPTPIERLNRLTAAVNNFSTFFIKREDCNSGLAFGGNKVRKLEYVLGDALAKGADTVVTTGGVQSNHMRQTAAAANRLGLKTVLAPQDAVPNESNEYGHLGNVQIDLVLGATLLPTGTTRDEAEEHVRQQGGKPYWIPSGASTHPLGGLGFARWAFELIGQEKDYGFRFDTIIVPTAAGSTLGGMVTGFKLAQKTGYETQAQGKRRLIGIQAMTQTKEAMAKLVLDIARTTGAHIGLTDNDISADDFEIDDRYNAGQYGKLDKKTSEAIKELARSEGILTDPVYTGKALAGMLHRARADEFLANLKILFVHTGGQAALSAYPALR